MQKTYFVKDTKVDKQKRTVQEKAAVMWEEGKLNHQHPHRDKKYIPETRIFYLFFKISKQT